jgi:hypothetical protein
MSDPPTPHRWALVSRNHLMAWGVFASEPAAWDFADQRSLPHDALVAIPLAYATLVRTLEQDELTRRIITEGHTEETEAMMIRAIGEAR